MERLALQVTSLKGDSPAEKSGRELGESSMGL